jgi:hypothetical protein
LNFEQHQSHIILANLRKNETDYCYKIPYGRFFYYFVSPHYIFEILIYFIIFLLSFNLKFYSSSILFIFFNF